MNGYLARVMCCMRGTDYLLPHNRLLRLCVGIECNIQLRRVKFGLVYVFQQVSLQLAQIDVDSNICMLDSVQASS